MPETLHYNLGWTYQQEKIRYFMLLKQEGENTDYIWTLDSNNDVTLIYYTGQRTSIKVPTMMEGHPVKYISAICYAGLNFIQSVTIPEGVITID